MEKKSAIIQNLSVNLDLAQSSLPDNVFTLAINYTNVNGKFVVTKKSVPAPKDNSKGTWPSVVTPCLNITAGQIGNQHYFIASGVVADYIFDGSTWLNITSEDRVTGSVNTDSSNLWTTCKLGFNTLVNNSEFFPEYWSGQFGTQLQGLPFSPTQTFKQKSIKCKAIRSHKNFLFALNLTEKGVEYPYSYRWSHPADENGLPFSWDELDLSTLASKESVGGDYGVIVDGLSLRDSFCIYTERAIHVLDYTGDEFVFRRRLLTSSYGCISQNCVVEAENLHYVITPSDIIVNDGSSVHSLLTGQLKKLYSNVSQRYYKNSFAVVNPYKTEVWFCFPEGDYVFPSMAIVYNYVTQQFGITRLASVDNGVGMASSLCFGIFLPVSYAWDDLDTYFTTWDNWTLPVEISQSFQGIGIVDEPAMPSATVSTTAWDNSSVSLLRTDLFCIGPSFANIEQLDGSRKFGEDLAGQIKTIFEKINWALDGQIAVKTLTRVYPNIVANSSTDAGIATLFVGAHDYGGSTIRWSEAIFFNPQTDRKIDVRTTGELLAIRFEFVGYNSLEFYGYTIEYTNNGAR